MSKRIVQNKLLSATALALFLVQAHLHVAGHAVKLFSQSVVIGVNDCAQQLLDSPFLLLERRVILSTDLAEGSHDMPYCFG